MTTNDEERFEGFLREFQPRSPAPLPALDPHRWGRLWMAAAAAAILVTSWTSVHFMTRPPAAADEPAGITAGSLSRSADWDVDRLDEILLQMSPRVLPDVERPGSTLRPLAAP